MHHRTVFCPECRQDATYTVSHEPTIASLKGEEYEFISDNAYCDNCFARVYVPSLADGNLKTLYDIYRQKK